MITAEQAGDIATQSVRHLLGLVGPQGRYVYAHPLNSPGTPLPGYNYLRHCGTTWFLCKAVVELGLALDGEDRARLSAAVGFVTERLAEPPWKEGFLPRLCLPEEGSVKIGANGLALLMLHEHAAAMKRLGAEQAQPALTLTIARLENYILSQAGQNDFIHKRRLSDGMIEPFHSDYYTGEVLFGLARGGRFTPQVAQLFGRLMESGYGIGVQSHWMCYAACESFKRRLMEPSKSGPYIARLVAAIVGDTAYRSRKQSTPIACRTEALLRFLQAERRAALLGFGFDPGLVRAARQAAEENLALQLGWHDAGQFHKGDGDLTVQIDYVQHNATAFLAWRLLNRG